MPKAKAKPEPEGFFREEEFIVSRCCRCSGGVTVDPGPDGCEARKPKRKTSRDGEKHHLEVLSEDTGKLVERSDTVDSILEAKKYIK